MTSNDKRFIRYRIEKLVKERKQDRKTGVDIEYLTASINTLRSWLRPKPTKDIDVLREQTRFRFTQYQKQHIALRGDLVPFCLQSQVEIDWLFDLLIRVPDVKLVAPPVVIQYYRKRIHDYVKKRSVVDARLDAKRLGMGSEPAASNV